MHSTKCHSQLIASLIVQIAERKHLQDALERKRNAAQQSQVLPSRKSGASQALRITAENLLVCHVSVCHACHVSAQGSWPPPALPQGASSPKVATDSAAYTQPQQQTQQQQQPQQRQQQQQQQEQPPPQQQQPAAHSSPPAGENAMNVVLVGAECAPWSKTGDTVYP